MMTKDETERVNALAESIAERINRGESPERIAQDLSDGSAADYDEAYGFVSSVAEAHRRQKKSTAKRFIWSGVISLVIGGAVTGTTIALAGPGGIHIFTVGAFIFGAYAIVRGLMELPTDGNKDNDRTDQKTRETMKRLYDRTRPGIPKGAPIPACRPGMVFLWLDLARLIIPPTGPGSPTTGCLLGPLSNLGWAAEGLGLLPQRGASIRTLKHAYINWRENRRNSHVQITRTL